MLIFHRYSRAMIVNSLLPLLVFALVCAGCASRAQQRAASLPEVRRWVDVNAREIRLMYGDGQNIELGPVVPQACAQLAADTLAVRAALPTPDDTLTADLGDAVTRYLQAAGQCAAGDQAGALQTLTGADVAVRAAEDDAARDGASVWQPQ